MNKFGLQRAYVTGLGCEVLEVKSIFKDSNVLTPVVNIILWVPEKDEKEVDKR
jgi:hypothetical protein